ncbi:class D sortase [Acetanaerobacterium elongatum]|uniref:Sortase A n=1 Tax=Acetanaerobacterium elongatum TaxID=258515 RepID=A0A1G9V261_9FIRM|nr:class D sortase [Acetanaerobacterium elongatum]SDM66312.1 sortase A [Acetanaerobacterium elongatum]
MTHRKRHSLLSNIIVVLGILLIAVSVAYEVIYYPWGRVLGSLGVAPQTELPNPKPLPVFAQAEQTAESAATVSAPTPQSLGDFFAARPKMNLTPLGVIKLPEIGISENIVEGSGDELFYGVGHIKGTALPGEAGNCVLSGHRNYIVMHPFRHLNLLAEGDTVTIEYEGKTYTYEVFKTFTVSPEQTDVLAPQKEENHLLTLVTCTPVLNPVNRLIVWCRLIE